MKQSIQLRLGQQLTMTPHLQQAIRLLQLSTSDLRQEIQETLDSNLMLENADEVERLGVRSLGESPETAGAAADPEQEIRPEHMPLPDELPVDVEWTWFINSLANRNDSVLKVAAKIVELQRGFLEYGEEAMKPMVLRDIAEVLGLHESTVSRVTTRKYMGTPRGTFEFKYFFSSHLSTDSGDERSATAVRACIRKLVAAEDPRHPLSDNRIATVLAGQGIQVARRTVAKYRERLGVPSSNERKRPS